MCAHISAPVTATASGMGGYTVASTTGIPTSTMAATATGTTSSSIGSESGGGDAPGAGNQLSLKTKLGGLAAVLLLFLL